MSAGQGSHLALSPDRCDACGRCVRACPRALVRVGSGFIYVDTSQCDGCMACADVCDRSAITRRSIPVRPTASSLKPGDVPKVVVGSRAEAKLLRRAAEDAESQRRAAEKTAVRNAKHDEVEGRRASIVAGDGLAPWSTADAVIVIAVLVVSVFAKNAAFGSQFIEVMPADAQVAARAVVLGLFYATQLGVLAVLAHRHGLRFSAAFGLGRLGRSWPHRLASAGLVIALFVGTRLTSLAWGAVAQAAGWSPAASDGLTVVFGAGGAGLALSVVMVALVGPFAEELVFRGVVQRALAPRWGTWPAIVAAASLYALAHVTAWVTVPLVVVGIATGWLAWSRGSLWPAIALHMLYNGAVVAAVFWVGR